jgi:hypothetical protein
LEALKQNDERLLYGRGAVVRELIENCRSERLSVVSAEPGLGMTSLLQAGVLPALRREGFITAIFNEWQGRFFAAGLREAVAEAARETDQLFFGRGEPLDELVQHITQRTGKPVAILLDQFEDYLRCHANTEISDAFDAELAHAIAGRKGVFVIGMQQHAIPAFGRLEQYIPNLLGYQIRLAPLGVETAREIVMAEARSAGLEVEPAALEALTTAPVLNTGVVKMGEDRIHPLFLKMATEQILDAETRVGARVIRAATIEARHGVDRMVLETWDASIGELGSTHLDLFFRWCRILISPEKHRLSVTEKGLTDYAGRLSRFVPAVLTRLMEMGILRSVEAPDALRYEISRECFTPILQDWWERREAMIVARRRARFRVRSLWIAVSTIVLLYAVWIILGMK